MHCYSSLAVACLLDLSACFFKDYVPDNDLAISRRMIYLTNFSENNEKHAMPEDARTLQFVGIMNCSSSLVAVF